jgi:heme/copper-type cytochrome/quinol oxidase subunit 2
MTMKTPGGFKISLPRPALGLVAAVAFLAATHTVFAQTPSPHPLLAQPLLEQPRVIEILADKDSHFKIAGQSKAQITVKAGEQVVLRIEARKGKTWNRGGVVHGFTMLRMKDRARVEGWDLELTPGVHEYSLKAPQEPGDYEVLCTVICSGDHEGMRMKVVVQP